MKMIIPGTKLKNDLIYVGVMLDGKGGHYHLLAKNKDEEGSLNWHEANKDRGLFVCPTSKELNLMRTISEVLGMTEWYWASTEYNNAVAWIQRFSDGVQGHYGVKNTNCRLRCVRRVDALTLQSLLDGETKEGLVTSINQCKSNTEGNQAQLKERLYIAAMQGLLASGCYQVSDQHNEASKMASVAKASVEAILKKIGESNG
jgi:hypothetical protein